MRRILLILLLCLPVTAWAATAIMNGWPAGELSPRVRGRTDVRTHYYGAREIENMYVTPLGPVSKRPGTYYIAEAAGQARVIEFEISDGSTIIELSDKSMRFFK